jgi:transposase-like protein
MQRVESHCPCCGRDLVISWDMWGSYYLCDDCGFTAEDDEELTVERAAPSAPAPQLATAQTYRQGEPSTRR